MLKKFKPVLKRILLKLKILRQNRREYLVLKKFQLENQIKISGANSGVFIIGCGRMGRNIAKTIRNMPGWKVSGVYDLSVPSAKQLIAFFKYEIPVYDSIEELLAAAAPKDILVIATHANSHVKIALQAIDHGIRKIFLEKPISTSLLKGRALADSMNKNDVMITVDHTRRWIPSCHSIKRMIESNVIGKIHSMHYCYGRAGFAMIGTHLIDFCRWLFDAEITKIKGRLDEVERSTFRGSQFKDPSGKCEFVMSNNVHVTIDLSDALAMKQDYYSIIGEFGRIEVDQRIGKVFLFGSAGRKWEENYQWKGMVELGVAACLMELNLNKEPRCSVKDGLIALEAIIGVHQSHRNQNEWIGLPLQGEITKEEFSFA